MFYDYDNLQLGLDWAHTELGRHTRYMKLQENVYSHWEAALRYSYALH